MAAFMKTVQLLRAGFACKTLLESVNSSTTLVLRRCYRPRWVAPTLRELKRRKDIENERNGGEKIFHRSTFLEWNYNAEIFAFANRLGEKFEDSVLRSALTHKSYIERESTQLQAVGVEIQLELQDNEKLATRGEQLINRFVNGYLRAVFSRAPEEFVQAVSAFLTSTETLEKIGKGIGLGDIMLCADFPCLPETYAKSFKALVAALEASSGEEKAKVFVQDLVLTQIYGMDINELWSIHNPVGILSDILKREGRGEPEFRLVKKTGSNTILAVYHVAVYSDRQFIAEGAGENLDVAQDMAARDALKRFFRTDDSMKALPFGRHLKDMQLKIAQSENNPNISLSEWSSARFAPQINQNI